jgi:hypothetical protein
LASASLLIFTNRQLESRIYPQIIGVVAIQPIHVLWSTCTSPAKTFPDRAGFIRSSMLTKKGAGIQRSKKILEAIAKPLSAQKYHSERSEESRIFSEIFHFVQDDSEIRFCNSF